MYLGFQSLFQGKGGFEITFRGSLKEYMRTMIREIMRISVLLGTNVLIFFKDALRVLKSLRMGRTSN